MLSDRVLQSILPLNDRVLCPYEEVFTLVSGADFLVSIIMRSFFRASMF